MLRFKNYITALKSIQFPILISALLFSLSVQVQAQPNQSPLIFAETDSEVSLIGIVRSFNFSSPATLIEVEVEGSAGQSSLWRVQTKSATELRRFGWTSQSLFAGELVQLVGTPVQGSRLNVELDELTRANGEVLNPNQESIFDLVVSGNYQPLPSQGNIHISFDHYGFSQSFFSFSAFDATLSLDAENINNSNFQIDLLAENISSNSAELTRLLKSGDFFDASNYPLISIQSRSFELLNDDLLVIVADIQIKGVSVAAEFEVELNASGAHPQYGVEAIGFSGNGEVLRSAWGLDSFIPEVGDSVSLQFHMEFGLPAEASVSDGTEALLYPYNQ